MTVKCDLLGRTASRWNRARSEFCNYVRTRNCWSESHERSTWRRKCTVMFHAVSGISYAQRPLVYTPIRGPTPSLPDSKILQGDVDIEILYRAIMIGDEFQVHEHVLHAAAEHVHSDKLDDGAFRIHYFFPVVWRDEAPVHMQGVTLFVRDGNIVNKFPILVQ